MDKIAVHLHLFYVDLLDEFLHYFNNIPYEFDIYISCSRGVKVKAVQQAVQQALPRVQKVIVRICLNRGRDIAPFYVAFRKELLQYDYILHVHSKKSKHMQEGGGNWRQYSLDSLVGNPSLVENIIERFKSESNLGLVYPDWHPDIPMIGYTWMANGESGKSLLKKLGISYVEGLFNYPAGSFFWARKEAVRPIFDLNLKYRHFPKEKGQIDGTTAHVLERAIEFVAREQGYQSGIMDIQEQTMRLGRSTKPFRPCLTQSLDAAKETLSAYASISFGVFDTLVSVAAFSSEDIIQMTAANAGLDHVFVELRKKAEERASAKYGSQLTIDYIYKELVDISPFDGSAAEKLKGYEMDCLISRVIPREDIRILYQYLLQAEKRISIVCDSFYRKSFIEAVLIRCGFIGYDKLWVSSEYGISKRDGRMWSLVFNKYDKKHHIHVGSNVYSDWYTLEVRNQDVMYIMSGKQAYAFSKYKESEKEEGVSLEESLKLGMQIEKEWFNSPFSLAENSGMQI